MQDRLHYALLALVLAAGPLLDPVQSAAADGKPVFEKDILPILQRHCVKCHQGPTAKARLDLTTRRGLLIGDLSGAAIRLRAAET
ncbi:MAG: c-type cytochrome domain-containing protein, partial [Planctomycetaceae bacterium]